VTRPGVVAGHHDVVAESRTDAVNAAKSNQGGGRRTNRCDRHNRTRLDFVRRNSRGLPQLFRALCRSFRMEGTVTSSERVESSGDATAAGRDSASVN
jgi:hypothetical protein